MTDLVMRQATADDAEAIHALISAHEREGHLLPRAIEELRRHAGRFVVSEAGGSLLACGELAPLSPTVAEVRSLVVKRDVRRVGLAARLVADLQQRATRGGFETLCAFTHDARFFVRQGFSIVPHLWVPEKISTDCVSCAFFRQCRQFAMVLSLQTITREMPETMRPARVA